MGIRIDNEDSHKHVFLPLIYICSLGWGLGLGLGLGFGLELGLGLRLGVK